MNHYTVCEVYLDSGEAPLPNRARSRHGVPPPDGLDQRRERLSTPGDRLDFHFAHGGWRGSRPPPSPDFHFAHGVWGVTVTRAPVRISFRTRGADRHSGSRPNFVLHTDRPHLCSHLNLASHTGPTATRVLVRISSCTRGVRRLFYGGVRRQRQIFSFRTRGVPGVTCLASDYQTRLTLAACRTGSTHNRPRTTGVDGHTT